VPYFYIFSTTDCHVEFDIAIAIVIDDEVEIAQPWSSPLAARGSALL